MVSNPYPNKSHVFQSFLVFGGETGWIGQKLVTLLKSQGKEVHIAKARLENRTDVERDIKQYQPKYILNCAGVVCIFLYDCISDTLQTGRPNVDWCEDHKQETIRYINISPRVCLMYQSGQML